MANEPKISWYDLETSGREPGFDVPLNVAVVTTDGNLNQVGQLELRCRPPASVLPAPQALVVQGQGIGFHQGQPLSLYEFTREFTAHVESLHPTIFAGYNSIRFDDEIMRHTLYRMLKPPYVMQFGGSRRIDLLPLAQCAYVLDPDSLTLPLSAKGKRTFALDAFAPANGFQGEGAHDAIVDVHATIHVAGVINERQPGLLDLATNVWSDKRAVCQLLESSEFLVVIAWNPFAQCPIIKAVAPVAANPTYATEWACVDLAFDPDDYMALPAEEMTELIVVGTRERPIVPVKSNAMPILFEPDHPLVQHLLPQPAEELIRRARAVQGNAGFATRVGRALALRREGFSDPEHVELQLYSGGFFSKADEARLAQFHAAPPEVRLGILDEVEDERLRTLGRRLVLDEWPHVMPPSVRAKLEQERLERLHSEDKVKWTTVGRALADIEKMRADAGPDEAAILDEYEEYLLSLPELSVAAE